MGCERTQGSDLPQYPSYNPAQNSLALAQAVTNGLSLLPGWWSVRSRPVPRLWGRGTWAACPAPPHHHSITSSKASPHFDLGGKWSGKWPSHPALTPSENKMLAADQREFKTPKVKACLLLLEKKGSPGSLS